MAAVALSLLLAPVAAYLEFRHIDDIVHASAEEISSGYRSHIGATGGTHSRELIERTRELLARGFTAVRIYDANHQVVLEMPAAAPGASEWHGQSMQTKDGRTVTTVGNETYRVEHQSPLLSPRP